MSAAELIVELVLTGLLMLTALVLPGLGGSALSQVTGDSFVPIVLAAAFVLGVIVDRCTDTILARWEGVIRCRYARNDAMVEERGRLGVQQPVDPFPEDFLRMQFLRSADEGNRRNAEQLRVRIRVARSVAILMPTLVTSSILALAPKPDFVRLLPVGHLILLVVAVSASARWTPPKTRVKAVDPKSAETLRGEVVQSAATLWFVVEAMFAVGATVYAATTHPQRLWPSVALLVGGVCLTGLALISWKRISETSMALHFRFVALAAPDDLRRALRRQAPEST